MSEVHMRRPGDNTILIVVMERHISHPRRSDRLLKFDYDIYVQSKNRGVSVIIPRIYYTRYVLCNIPHP